MPVPTTDSHLRNESNVQRRRYWQEDAACLGVGTHVFFPTVGRGDCKARLVKLFAEAKQYCDNCPVRVPCVESQLKVEAETLVFDGMWGGLLPYERKAILADRQWAENTKAR